MPEGVPPLENTGINSRCIQVAPHVNSSFYYKVIVTVSLKTKLLETEFIQNFVKKKKRQKMYKLPSFLPLHICNNLKIFSCSS